MTCLTSSRRTFHSLALGLVCSPFWPSNVPLHKRLFAVFLLILQVEQSVKTDITASAQRLSVVVVRGRSELRHLREQRFKQASDKNLASRSLPARSISCANSPSHDSLPALGEEVTPQVARIVLHSAQVMASLSSGMEVNGVIGGVEVTDLTPEGVLYKQVCQPHVRLSFSCH